MSGSDLKLLQERLLQRLKAIPDGSVAAVARRAGLHVRQLNRLRAGDNLDVRLSTLAKLSVGLGMAAEELIGRLPAEPVQLTAVVEERQAKTKTVKAVMAAQRHVRALLAALEQLAEDEGP